MGPRRLIALGLALASLGLAGFLGGRQLWANWHYAAAQKALARHHPSEAARHLDRCLGVWRDSAPVRLLAAQAARQAGDFDAAEEHLEAHRRLDPDAGEQRGLELALLRAQNGDLEKVEGDLLDRVHAGDPKSPLILEALIEGNLRMYRFTSAMSSLTIWLSHQPDNPRALFLRGRAWERVGAFERAIKDYARVVELDVANNDARLRLVNALIQQGKFDETLPHLAELKRWRPNDPEVLVRLAYARNALGEPEEADALLADLLRERPDYGPALLGRGQIAFQARRLDDAERWLRKALEADPADRQSNYVYFQCLQRQGRTKEAEAQGAKLKSIEKDISRLIEIGNRDMNQRPRDPALHHEVGAIQRRMGQVELARRWFHSALMLDPNYRPAHASLAEHYEAVGQPEEAERHRRLAHLAP
jgi:tetratricopeptide (TPR) repeat protein